MFLEIAKMLLNKDTRESVRSLVSAVLSKPEWKQELFAMSAAFRDGEEAEARLFVKITIDLLQERGWNHRQVGAAEFAIQEVVDNAFLHGIPVDQTTGRVDVETTLCTAWVRCKVSDRGSGFCLEDVLATQSRYGPRGLYRVNQIATSLFQKAPSTVVVRIDVAPGKIVVSENDGILEVRFSGELIGRDCGYETALAAFNDQVVKSKGVLLDLSQVRYLSSTAMGMIVTFVYPAAKNNKPFAGVLSEDSRVWWAVERNQIPQVIRFHESRESALSTIRGVNSSGCE
ncbi:MAG: hypothetical protein R3D98_06490 [Candidatus Krumholzibacteriia bacterium]